MVYIPLPSDVDRLTAYLFTDLSDDELKAFKDKFELGTCAPFATMLELVIKKPPEDYLGKSHSYIRRKETEAGRDDSFVIIDEEVVKRGAVWYVERFADEDEVEDGVAASTDVLWKILVKTECLALTWVNYDIANMTLVEDLDIDFPAQEDYVQEEVSACGGLDMEEFRHEQAAFLTAWPDEFEETTDPDILANFAPPPSRVCRLKEDVARAAGVKSSWSFPSDPRDEVEMPDGSTKKVPKGSIDLQQRFDPNFAWPPYKWPEESL